MSGGQANASQSGLDYYNKANPWNGDGNHHEDWLVLDSLAVDCRFEPAVGGTSEALRVAVLPIREGKCLPGVFATNGQ